MSNEAALAVQQRGELLSDEVLQPVMNLEVAKKRLAEFQAFVKDYLKEGEDFGTIPGTPKPTLLKPGADKLCELYGLSDSYEIVDKVEDFDAHPPLFDYTIRCVLTRIRTGLAVASGLGSCNSYEKKYRWRDSSRKCPQCMKETIIKGKEEFGGGFLCYAKKGGCGAKFKDDDPAITKQTVGRVENEDIADIKNTILKMSKKRAKIDATLSATRSSGVFTQDVEDIAAGAEYVPTETKGAAPKGRTQSKPAAQGENVVCSECRATNSHSPACSYNPKNKASDTPPAAQAAPQGAVVYELTVDKVESLKTKVVEKDGKKSGGRPFGKIYCHDANGTEMQVCIFHETPQKYMGLWQGKVCEFEIAGKAAAQGGTMYSLDKVHKVGDVRYVDNAPAKDEAPDVGFDEE